MTSIHESLIEGKSQVGDSFPYRLVRVGVLMTPEDGNELEAEGVLNPGSGRDAEENLYLLPRLVAAGNVSRVGLARVNLAGGVPDSVTREGVVLAPDRSFERGAHSAGVEDPRVTWIAELGLQVMTYVANGPLGPKTAIATSTDLRSWIRLGPVLFRYHDDQDLDLNLFHNKDTVFFPVPVTDPFGVRSLAVLHRPMWDLEEIKPGQGNQPPPTVDDPRQSIWVSFVPLTAVQRDPANLVLWQHHRFLAGPKYPFEELKIGAGPPPVRVPEGWLVLHHGVTGTIEHAFERQQHVNYAVGGMILAADQPWRVLARTPSPLLEPATGDERFGIVPNVVFPTAIEEIDGTLFVFYGMADSKIGIARIERSTS